MTKEELHEAVEEFYVENREEHLRKTIGTSDFCKSMMAAFHKHALEEKIKELEKERLKWYKSEEHPYNEGVEEGLSDAIFILKQEQPQVNDAQDEIQSLKQALDEWKAGKIKRLQKLSMMPTGNGIIFNLAIDKAIEILKQEQ